MFAMYLCQAKDMVGLVNKFAAKMEDKKGSVSEDEVRHVVLHACACLHNMHVDIVFDHLSLYSHLLLFPSPPSPSLPLPPSLPPSLSPSLPPSLPPFLPLFLPPSLTPLFAFLSA